jgi:gliding-associated putative ABC transporter substrate-binding component GldG
MKLPQLKTKNLFNWTLLSFIFIGLLLINIISSIVGKRIDMTKDHRYSLASGTSRFLESKENIENRISLQIYLEGNLPAELKSFQNALKDKLKDFKYIAGNRIEYVFIDPNNGSKEEQKELKIQLYDQGRGILPMEIIYTKDGESRQVMLWPGAKMTYSANGIVKENIVQFLPGTKPGNPYNLAGMTEMIEMGLNNLEYNIISNMRRLTQTEKQRIGFLQGHDELTYPETQRARALIAPYFSIADISLNDSIAALDDIDGLVIADPKKPFSDRDLYLIDQFVMRGGKLMCLMNTLAMDEDTLMTRGTCHTTRKNLILDRMLYDYGLKINENYVLDVNCAPKIVPFAEQTFVPWFFSILSTPSAHPITRNIEPVYLKYANEIQFVKMDNLALTPILTTSTNSNKTGLAPLVSLGFPLNFGRNPELVQNPEDEINKICVAGLAEGYFRSHFENRVVPEFVNRLNDKNIPEKYQYKSKSDKEGKVLVVGNGNFIFNRFDSMPNPRGLGYVYVPSQFNDLKMDPELFQRGVRFYHGNQEFFQNIVDYMMGDNSVLDIRSRQIEIKKIDREKIKLHAGFYKIVNLLAPIGTILLLAFGLNFIRKKRYAQVPRKH